MTSPNAVDANLTQSQDETPEQIQLEIARTRLAITEDLRVLSERYGPAQLKESAREVIHEARLEATELMRDAKQEAKELMRDAKEVAFGGLIDMKDRAIESVGQRVNLLGERASELGTKAREAANLTVGYASQHAVLISVLGAGAGWLLIALRNYRREQRGVFERDRAYEAGPRAAATLATRTADRARESAHSAAGSALGRVRGTAAQARHFASDHRGAVVALTVVAGLGLGLLLPIGRRPRRALRSAGERAWHGAQTTARDVAGRARGLAAETAEPIRHLAADAAVRTRELTTRTRAAL